MSEVDQEHFTPDDDPTKKKIFWRIFSTVDEIQHWIDGNGTYLGCYLAMLWGVVGFLIHMHDANQMIVLVNAGWVGARAAWKYDKSQGGKIKARDIQKVRSKIDVLIQQGVDEERSE